MTPLIRRFGPLALFAVCLAAFVLALIFIHLLFNWVLTFTGSKNEGGPWYGFWSGFGGSFLAPQPAIFVTMWVLLRHHNCHVKGCWFLGHKVEGTPYVACHRHHPDHEGDGKRNVTEATIHAAFHRNRRPKTA